MIHSQGCVLAQGPAPQAGQEVVLVQLCCHSLLLSVREAGLILASLPGETVSPPLRDGTRSTAELLLLWQESHASS